MHGRNTPCSPSTSCPARLGTIRWRTCRTAPSTGSIISLPRASCCSSRWRTRIWWSSTSIRKRASRIGNASNRSSRGRSRSCVASTKPPPACSRCSTRCWPRRGSRFREWGARQMAHDVRVCASDERKKHLPISRAHSRRAMEVKTYVDRLTMSRAAARHAAEALRDEIGARGAARIVAATGASQFDFLEALTAAPAIDWTRVEMFHLDEYVGLPLNHPASFRKYLLDRLVNKVGIARFHLLDGERDPSRVADQVGRELA